VNQLVPYPAVCILKKSEPSRTRHIHRPEITG
jgi:hypothetical protein